MPEKFTTLTATAVPLLRPSIDTDAIIPSREIKTATRTGLAAGLFAGWRYRAVGSREADPGFILNQPGYQHAQILLGGANFGCGSSREHAVWALHEYGFRVVIAPSFAPIFYGNCIRNGLLPVRLEQAQIETLAAVVTADPANLLRVDLEAQRVATTGGLCCTFEIDAESRQMLLQGMDAIDLSLQHAAEIAAFLQQDQQARPWIYPAGPVAGAGG